MNRNSLRLLLMGSVLTAFPGARAWGVVVGPYVPDANTLHLYHFDDVGGTTAADAGSSPVTLNLTGGATFEPIAFDAPFGASLSTIDDAFQNLDAGAFGGEEVNLARAGADGAFTYEALLSLAIDPAASGPTGGNMQIISMENDGGVATRVFQWRLLPIGAASAGVPASISMEFINVGGAGGTQSIVVPLPADGDNSVLQGGWFHAAVSYNGQEGTPDSLKMYWTAMDANQTLANQIFSGTLNADLIAAPADFAVGNEARAASEDNFVGLIDEVRMSDIARDADQMMFAVPEPSACAMLAIAASSLLAARRRGSR